MKMSCLLPSRLPWSCLLLGLGLVLSGCSKGSKPSVMSSTSFDAAPAELKQRWKVAGDYAGKGNYLAAVTNLIFILNASQQLTPDQSTALSEAWTQIGNQAFQAGEKGDKNAVQAVLEMRNSGFGKSRGDR